jgi:hypothetical protein
MSSIFRNCSWASARVVCASGIAQLQRELMEMGGGQVLKVDIKSFFDTIDRSHLRS